MGDRTLFPNASTRATLAYCWSQMRPDRAAFAGSCTAIVARHAGQCRGGTADLRRSAGPHRPTRRRPRPVAVLRPADHRLRGRLGGCDGVRAYRWLAQLGRHPALVRSRHHQRLRPPDRTQPRMAHRPTFGRGHRHPRDVDLGLRRADRRHGLGHPAHQCHDARGHRRPRDRGLAGRAGHGQRWWRCSWSCCIAVWIGSSPRRRTSRTRTPGPRA